VTSTLPFGTVEDVKRDVERCINLAIDRGRGGFFLMTANVVNQMYPLKISSPCTNMEENSEKENERVCQISEIEKKLNQGKCFDREFE